MKFIIAFLFIIHANAIEHLSIHPYLKKGQSALILSTGTWEDEKTYEKDSDIIDMSEQKGYVQTLNYKKAFSNQFTFSIELQLLVDGTYSENYSGSLSHIPDKKQSSHGPREPLFKGYYWLDYPGKEFKHAFLFSLRPKIIEPKAHEFFTGRNELSFSYLYRYQRSNFEVAGDIYSTIFGKKEVRLDSGAEDTIEAFTEVGLRFNPGLIFERFSIHVLSAYSSMTDYNTKNSYFSRYSDKGYAVEIGIKINYKISNSQGISWFYLNRESYFNSIEEDLSRAIEYEIDSDEHRLSWWLIF